MKKLRFFGLLVTVVLLAFGLALACSNGTTDEGTSDERTSTFEKQTADGLLKIVFSNKEIARARAGDAILSGDNYVIYLDNVEISVPPTLIT